MCLTVVCEMSLAWKMDMSRQWDRGVSMCWAMAIAVGLSLLHFHTVGGIGDMPLLMLMELPYTSIYRSINVASASQDTILVILTVK